MVIGGALLGMPWLVLFCLFYCDCLAGTRSITFPLIVADNLCPRFNYDGLLLQRELDSYM